MKKVIIIVGFLVFAFVAITFILYFISREPKVTEEIVSAPNPTEEYQKFINDTSIKKIFFGILPCNDCEGTQTIIVFAKKNEADNNGTFEFLKTFLGTDRATERITGNWIMENNAQNATESGIFVLNFDNGSQEKYEQLDSRNIIKLDDNLNQMQEKDKNYTLTLK